MLIQLALGRVLPEVRKGSGSAPNVNLEYSRDRVSRLLKLSLDSSSLPAQDWERAPEITSLSVQRPSLRLRRASRCSSSSSFACAHLRPV